MIRTLILASALLASIVPAFAEDVVLRIHNQSSQPVLSFNAYPVVAGTLSTTSIGSLAEGVPAGGSVNLKLSSAECGVVHIYVHMLDQSQTDATLNTCARRDIVVTN